MVTFVSDRANYSRQNLWYYYEKNIDLFFTFQKSQAQNVADINSNDDVFFISTILSRMCRFKNPQSGVEYIYDKTSRIAIAHYTDKIDGDWILDDYGIRDWVESLPVKSISMATIANSYRVIGL